MKRILTLLLVLFSTLSFAQPIPANRLVDWKRAGLPDTIPSYTTVVNIMNHGGVSDGTANNFAAFQAAVAALGGAPGVVYFPPGVYRFEDPIYLRDSLILKGDGKQSTLVFDLNSNDHLININGSSSLTPAIITQPVAKNDDVITVASTAGINIGDWLRIYGNDATLVTSPWALGTVGQIFQVKNIQGNNIISHQPFRRNYDLSFLPVLDKITPAQGVGIECMTIERYDPTVGQTSHINFSYAVNSWVTGVLSATTNFAHVAASYASHLLVRGCYFNDAHNYGDGGKGYGVMLQLTTGDCLVENNTFDHLRHAMILQAGANGNVFAYNYSRDPFWSQPPLPANSAGDAVLHGNYAYANLFEGNILHNIVVDNSHGQNGPYNTFFRNRAIGYGIFHNNTLVTDSMNYIGNEITGAAGSGLYTITGVGHHLQGNNVKGTLQPAGTTAISEFSLYLNRMSPYFPPAYWNDTTTFPSIGSPAAYNNTEEIPAKKRYDNSMFIDCTLNPNFIPNWGAVTGVAHQPLFKVYPNPATTVVTFTSDAPEATLAITDITGKMVHMAAIDKTGAYSWHCGNLPAGVYICKLMSGGTVVKTSKLSITR